MHAALKNISVHYLGEATHYQLILPDWSISIPTWSPQNAFDRLPGSNKLKRITANVSIMEAKLHSYAKRK